MGVRRQGRGRDPPPDPPHPLAPDLAGGISCFEVAGLSPAEVTDRLAARKTRTNPSPYRIPYARVAAGVMNSPEEVETVLAEFRAIA